MGKIYNLYYTRLFLIFELQSRQFIEFFASAFINRMNYINASSILLECTGISYFKILSIRSKKYCSAIN